MRSFRIRSLRYLNGRTLSPFPAEAGHIRLLEDEIRQAFNLRIAEVLTGDETPPQLEVKTTFNTGSTEMDTIDDLLEEGGSLTDLTITVLGKCDRVYFSDQWWVRILGRSKPDVDQIGVTKDAIWRVHGKLNAIFKSREIKLKNLDESLSPWWVYVIIPVLGIAAWDSHNPTLRTIGAVLLAVLAIVWAVGFIVFSIPSRVFLVRSHVRSRDSKETRRKYLVNAVIFVLGLLVKTAWDFITKKFLK